jgi:hypothetical protein
VEQEARRRKSEFGSQKREEERGMNSGANEWTNLDEAVIRDG